MGRPAWGTVHGVSAMPIERTDSFARVASASTCASVPPSSASAPISFSISTVPPTPRRPAVWRLSWTATSSSTTTDRTSMPSAAASSPAISKFITSPV